MDELIRSGMAIKRTCFHFLKDGLLAIFVDPFQMISLILIKSPDRRI